MTVRLLLVCAVSTPEQARDDKESMASQERDLLAIAARENWDVIDIIRIPGFSRRYFTLRELVEAANAAGEPGPAQLEKHLADCDFDVMAVRSTNRFGREQSLNAEIIGRVVRGCGARIYSQMDGMIDAQNFRPMTAITGYRDAGQIDELVQKRQMGIVGLAKKGLPSSSRPPMSHRLVRDAKTGKADHLELREELLPMWVQVAELLIEGIAFGKLEQAMFLRFGYHQNGKPYNVGKLRRTLLNPVFWGNSVIRWFHKKQTSYPAGVWAFDESVPAPAGVDMFYDTHQPVYTGELAEAVKAELRRREEVFNRFSGGKTKRFAGVVYCETCGWSYVYRQRLSRNRQHYYYYLRCNRYLKGATHMQYSCVQKTALTQATVQRWLNEKLEGWLASGGVTISTANTPQEDSAQKLSDLAASIKRLERRRENLIDELGDSDETTRQAIRKRIHAANEEIERQQQAALKLQAIVRRTERHTYDQQTALAHIRTVGLEAFWQESDLAINQWIKRILGSTRLVASDGKIIGFLDLNDLKRSLA